MPETELLFAQSAPKDYQVRIVDGPDAPKTIAVDVTMSLGTSQHCDVVLTDPAVSRRHCFLEPLANGVAVRDDRSKNGCFVQGMRIHAAELPSGTTLTLGRTKLIVEEAKRESSTAPTSRHDRFGGFIGSARSLQPMYRRLEKAAPSDVTVLLEGESGTGKEVLAEAIHRSSKRRDGPFVVVDFAAMPESLIESELFGHEKGAFTGADEARAGAFEEASGGTVFLDEIGELPAALQTRLLGVLERRSFRRVGGRGAIDVDVRVVAATNRNLEREVEDGRFRLDLFHRLAVALVRVPPLRERPEDVEALARHFARQMGADVRLDDELVQRLQTHEWKGNVRELRNYVERLGVFGEDASLFGGTADVDTGSLHALARRAVDEGLSYRQARGEVTDRFTQSYVEALLERHDGDVAKASDAAQVARRHFNRLRKR